MVKITFEISEDFINEKTNLDNVFSKKDEYKFEVFADYMVYTLLKSYVKEGITEFLVSPDDFKDKTLEIYNKYIPRVCSLAVLSKPGNPTE